MHMFRILLERSSFMCNLEVENVILVQTATQLES